MELKDFRNQSAERLNELALELRAKIRDLRFVVGTRQGARVRDLRQAKRELARILTVQNEKLRLTLSKTQVA